jgi:phosphoserine phosphatase
MPDTAFPVVVFDLDGTLLRGTTVSLLLAQWLERKDEVSELERAFRAHEISNSVVADTSAGWLAGRSRDEAWRVLMEDRGLTG